MKTMKVTVREGQSFAKVERSDWVKPKSMQLVDLKTMIREEEWKVDSPTEHLGNNTVHVQSYRID